MFLISGSAPLSIRKEATSGRRAPTAVLRRVRPLCEWGRQDASPRLLIGQTARGVSASCAERLLGASGRSKCWKDSTGGASATAEPTPGRAPLAPGS